LSPHKKIQILLSPSSNSKAMKDLKKERLFMTSRSGEGEKRICMFKREVNYVGC